MNKTMWYRSLLILVAIDGACHGAVNIGKQWQAIKDDASALKANAATAVKTMKAVKKSTELVEPTLAFVSDLKQEMPRLMSLMESLSKTLKNMQTVGGKQYADPKMRKETMLVVFNNAISKADEIFNKFFAILYNLEGIITKAGELRFVDDSMRDQFKQVLLACRAVAAVTMKFFQDRLGPDLIDFLYRLETINPAGAIKK